nr:GAK system ATP-grasp enzyme [Desulfobulbaceae bacterium]
MKLGVVGTTGGWSSEMLADTIAAKTGFRLLIDMEKTTLDLDTGEVWFNDIELSTLDGLLIKKIGARYSPDLLDRLEVLRFLHEKGLAIFSAPDKILRVLDRLSCTVTLRSAGIPMPPTTITEDTDCALTAVRKYGKAVFKPLYSSKARGMEVISDVPDAASQIAAFKEKNTFMYIQKKIDLGGRDLGVVFLGGKYLTTYARCNTGTSWNTTTTSGGKYEAYTPHPSLIQLAAKAQSLFGLDFTCVDVVETANGPVVFEVSAFGGFRGITTTSDFDPASLLVDYVMETIDHV